MAELTEKPVSTTEALRLSAGKIHDEPLEVDEDDDRDLSYADSLSSTSYLTSLRSSIRNYKWVRIPFQFSPSLLHQLTTPLPLQVRKRPSLSFLPRGLLSSTQRRRGARPSRLDAPCVAAHDRWRIALRAASPEARPRSRPRYRHRGVGRSVCRRPSGDWGCGHGPESDPTNVVCPAPVGPHRKLE